MGRIRPAVSSGHAFSHDALAGSVRCALSDAWVFSRRRDAWRLCNRHRRPSYRRKAVPSLTPYLGVLYPSSTAKYVTEISNNKEIGSAFAVFLKSEFDEVADLAFSPEVVDLQPFIWQGFATELRYTYRLSLTNLRDRPRQHGRRTAPQRSRQRGEAGRADRSRCGFRRDRAIE